MGNCGTTMQADHDGDIDSSYSPVNRPMSNNSKSASYRGYLVPGYTHEVQLELIHKYRNTEFSICVAYVPHVINNIIELYYNKYQIYGATLKSFRISHLPELENIVYDINDIYYSQNKIYIKDYNNYMYSFINSVNDNYETYLYETYPFQNFLYLKDIKYIKNSLFNNNRKIIKLNNGDIFQQNNKIQNGYNNYTKISYFRKKKLNVIQIDCGSNHTLFLTSSGCVYSMGNNDEAQCGIIKTKRGIRVYDSYIKTPTLIQTFVDKNCNIVSISCGEAHNCCIDSSKDTNNVWMFGRNKSFQCCNSKNLRWIDPPRKNKIFKDINVTKALCGRDFTAILSNRGYLYGLGNLNRRSYNHYLEDVIGVHLLNDNRNKVKDFSAGCNYIVWLTFQNEIYSLESKLMWVGWSMGRSFFNTQRNKNKTKSKSKSELNSNTPIHWHTDMFPMYSPSKIDKIVCGKHHFVIIGN